MNVDVSCRIAMMLAVSESGSIVQFAGRVERPRGSESIIDNVAEGKDDNGGRC